MRWKESKFVNISHFSILLKFKIWGQEYYSNGMCKNVQIHKNTLKIYLGQKLLRQSLVHHLSNPLLGWQHSSWKFNLKKKYYTFDLPNRSILQPKLDEIVSLVIFSKLKHQQRDPIPKIKGFIKFQCQRQFVNCWRKHFTKT